jgi:DNA-binding transcriptional regulator YhcF (GntR family)
MHTDFVISQADGRPMYLQLIEQIKRKIAVGDWQPGQEIPSIRALAASTQVSVITVKRVYSDLEREGVIVTRQGKGSFVSDTVGLGAELKDQELDVLVNALADLSVALGLSLEELAERLRQARTMARKEGS